MVEAYGAESWTVTPQPRWPSRRVAGDDELVAIKERKESIKSETKHYDSIKKIDDERLFKEQRHELKINYFYAEFTNHFFKVLYDFESMWSGHL